ncbi:hypothetical protein VKT23_010876 [Stygiomarasmius scandens]|uniref:VWFA domain-containing protein n=1 Tax=Marasmiellus scandens TaxID=2682957 RepID=A0ABR1JB97_9AGAR
MSTSVKQRWIHESTERTKILHSGQFQSSAITWSFVSGGGTIPLNAINLANKNDHPSYLCRSVYENQLYVGRAESTQAFIVDKKGKHRKVKEYEVLVQTSIAPQCSFLPTQPNNAPVNVPIAKPAQATLEAPVLSGMDIVFVVDDSDSMGECRWDEVQVALSDVAEACGKFDADGFDLHFLNTEGIHENITNCKSVKDVFSTISPDGATPTGGKLKQVLHTYISRLEDKSRPAKPVAIVVITDGEPTDNELESVIVNAAHRLEAGNIPEDQLYIHFIQIGDEPGAADALKHLDNALSTKHHIPDIVGTSLSNPLQPQFKTEELSIILQSMWKRKETRTHSRQSETTAFDAPAYARSRMEWVQKAKSLTTTLSTPVSQSSTVPYAWIFIENGVFPSNAIVCGKEDDQNTFLFRTFYEGQMRFGTVTAGSKEVKFFVNDSQIKFSKEYEILVQPSAFLYSFASFPMPAPTRKMDVVLLVDDSDSMADSLWSQARDALAAVAEASPQHDTDGVDLYFLNNTQIYQKNIKTQDEVVQLFNKVIPDGATPIGKRLQQLLDEYIPQVEQQLSNLKPVNIIVITDGEPTDNVESVIVNASRQLSQAAVPERMLGIQFVQIGNDSDATKFLQHLDNQLKREHQITDMVDTTPYDSSKPFEKDTLVKILWGAIDKEVDVINE